MKANTNEDIALLKRYEDTNNLMVELFAKQRNGWNKTVHEIVSKIHYTNLNTDRFHNIVEAQSLILSNRQNVIEEINTFLGKLSVSKSNLKKHEQEKLLFYSVSFSYKANTSEKKILMDGSLYEVQREIEIIASYVEFLRDTIKTLDNISYSIKNISDLLNYISK